MSDGGPGHSTVLPTPGPVKSGYQPYLDGVRGIAVLAIVAFHARTDWFPGAYIGVDLFFVISGFLITGILIREFDKHNRIDLRNFYLRRALRLLPALILVCAVVAVLLLLFPQLPEREATFRGALTAITYLSSPVAASGIDLGWFTPTWSLSVEEYFYLLWPFVLLLALRSKHALRWVLLLTTASIAYRWLIPVLTDWDLRRISYGADTRVEQLLIGVSLAMLLKVRPLRPPEWILILGTAIIAVYSLLPASWTDHLYRSGASTVIALVVALMVAALVAHPDGWFARLLSVQPLLWVGRRSYGIYLWNLPVVGAVAATGLPGMLQIVLKIVLSFAVPAVSYALVELPFLRWKSRLRRRADA